MCVLLYLSRWDGDTSLGQIACATAAEAVLYSDKLVSEQSRTEFACYFHKTATFITDVLNMNIMRDVRGYMDEYSEVTHLLLAAGLHQTRENYWKVLAGCLCAVSSILNVHLWHAVDCTR